MGALGIDSNISLALCMMAILMKLIDGHVIIGLVPKNFQKICLAVPGNNNDSTIYLPSASTTRQCKVDCILHPLVTLPALNALNLATINCSQTL